MKCDYVNNDMKYRFDITFKVYFKHKINAFEKVIGAVKL